MYTQYIEFVKYYFFVMALKHTLLAFLSRQPLSGYDVAKEFDRGMGSCFWKASQQQIYAELAKLERNGNLTYEAIPQKGRLDKKIYYLTAQGQQELLDWLVKPCEPTAMREDLGVMGLAGHLVPSEVVVNEIKRRRQLHWETAQQVKALDEHFAQNLSSLAIRDLYVHLIIRRAIRYQEDWVAWCDESLRTIEQAQKH
jgi:DNA-binding PadR family transcriptional regulator